MHTDIHSYRHTFIHFLHSFIHTDMQTYIHTARNNRSAAQQNAARDARVHTNPHVYIVAMWVKNSRLQRECTHRGSASPFPSCVVLRQILEAMLEVMQIFSQEFVQNRTVEQIVVPVGHGVEVYLLPKEVDEKVKKCVQKTVKVIQLVPQERIQDRIAEEVVDIPLPQIMEVRIVRWNRSWTSPFSRFRRKLPSWRHSACIPPGTDSACSCHPFPSVFFFHSALLGSSSSSHPQACNAVGTSDGVIPLSRI